MRACMRSIAVGLLLVVSCGLGQSAELWTEDFEAAKAQAAKENKDLLVDFTGSDWCGWCMRLDKEVFGQDAFQKGAPALFVLVKLDFPRNKPQTDAIRKRNRMLQGKYGVRGFPTILLMDAKGEVYAKTGYRPGGPEGYLQHLKELQAGKAELHALRTAAATADGLDKAKALDKLADHLTTKELPVDESVYKEICDLDKENVAGLKAKYEGRLVLNQVSQKLEAAAQTGNMDEVIRLITEAIKNPKIQPEQKQHLAMVKANVLMRQGKVDAALAGLKEALKLAPNSELAKKIPDYIKQVEDMQKKAAPPPAPQPEPQAE